MKKIFCWFLLLVFHCGSAQVSVVSWNIANFGKSKSDSTIVFIAKTLENFDIVALQEVVAGNGGAQAVARLASELNRTGSKWDYIVSDPTTGNPHQSERYAFLWKTATIKKIGKAWLDSTYSAEIEREPYLCRFQYEQKVFTLVSFHAIPKKRQPETEIKYFKFFPQIYSSENLVFSGDFNLPQSHTVFHPLRKIGFKPTLTNSKTSLRQNCDKGDCLASEYDNIWYDSAKIFTTESDTIPFHLNFSEMQEARKVSDHLPVFTCLYLL
ncbi:MAG TPA: endonuclease/exonuclease/phosphatase family protein [Flavobacterium sp.]|jgi:hypothetical protein